MDVALLRWPDERDRRAELQSRGLARLLLVEGDEAPPEVVDLLEDWIRLPAHEADVAMRVASLASRAHRRDPTPELDDDGLLRVGGRWVSLPPVEARLMGALLARYRAVVSRDALARAGWPQGSPGRNALDVHVLRLRRRVAAVGLAIRTVRSRGYLLEHAGAETATT